MRPAETLGSTKEMKTENRYRGNESAMAVVRVLSATSPEWSLRDLCVSCAGLDETLMNIAEGSIETEDETR